VFEERACDRGDVDSRSSWVCFEAGKSYEVVDEATESFSSAGDSRFEAVALGPLWLFAQQRFDARLERGDRGAQLVGGVGRKRVVASLARASLMAASRASSIRPASRTRRHQRSDPDAIPRRSHPSRSARRHRRIGTGALATAIYAHTKHWTTVIPTLAWAGGIAAAVFGAVAGFLPATRAARLAPRGT
jgi:hypothetical protein